MDNTTAGVIAAIGAGAGVFGKTLLDFYREKRTADTKDKESENQAETAAQTAEQTAQAQLLHNLSTALSATNETATHWMNKYADLIGEFGVVKGEIAELKSRTAALEKRAEEAEQDKRAALDDAKVARLEAAAHREMLAVRDTEINDLKSQRDNIQRGFDGVVTLLQGSAENRLDPGIANAATAAIKSVLDYNARKDC